jgi:hypothetical protein
MTTPYAGEWQEDDYSYDLVPQEEAWEQVTGREYIPPRAVPVRMVEAPERNAPEFAGWSTVNIGQAGQINASPYCTQLVNRRYNRFKTKFGPVIFGAGCTSVVFNNKPDALSGLNPQGWTVLAPLAPVTLQNTGSFTSPGIGQIIAEVTGVPTGTYSVAWTVSLGGTTSGTDADNFALNNGAAQVLVAMNGSGSGTVAAQPTVTVQVPANGTVSITAIVAGTVASVYRGQLVLTLEDSAGVPASQSLPDYDGEPPLYAVAVGGTASVSVIDESYGAKKERN